MKPRVLMNLWHMFLALVVVKKKTWRKTAAFVDKSEQERTSSNTELKHSTNVHKEAAAAIKKFNHYDGKNFP